MRPLESFTHPQDWRLTECLKCGNVAHYRFVYTLDLNDVGEPTCRACYWRHWSQDVRTLQGGYVDVQLVTYEHAQQVAQDNGFVYLGPLTAPSLSNDPHRTQCQRCGKISAERLGDIAFGCTCKAST